MASLAFDSSGSLVATAGMDGGVRLWDAHTGSSVGVLEGSADAIEFVAWHPRGKVLLVGSHDLTACLFNAEQQQCMQVFSGHTGAVTAGAPHCCLPLVTNIALPLHDGHACRWIMLFDCTGEPVPHGMRGGLQSCGLQPLSRDLLARLHSLSLSLSLSLPLSLSLWWTLSFLSGFF